MVNVKTRPFKCIVAHDQGFGIGKGLRMAWRISSEFAFFKKTTTEVRNPEKRNAVIFGRNTWETNSGKPLPARFNVVVSSKLFVPPSEDVVVVRSLGDALTLLSSEPYDRLIETVWLCGGSRLYQEGLTKYRRLCTEVIVSEIDSQFGCDTFFPHEALSGGQEPPPPTISLPEGITDRYATFINPPGRVSYRKLFLHEKEDIDKLTQEQVHYKVYSYLQENPEEEQYLGLVAKILTRGATKGDRTGVGTISLFGEQMNFDLSNNVFPLLTTKRIFWKGVVEELLWFLKGDTSALRLAAKGVRIWDENGTREFLDKRGLKQRAEGDLGPIYGFQWRHFGAKYLDMNHDYGSTGIDQVQEVLNTLRTNPNDRRMIISAWNPAALHEMALPPCHVLAQFYVCDGELSCSMYQRSCDMGLGVPFNIASYSLLTRLMAHCTDLKPGRFTHFLGDAHVYNTHVDALTQQLLRTPGTFPVLNINPSKTDLFAITAQDLDLVDYYPQETIKMAMAV